MRNTYEMVKAVADLAPLERAEIAALANNGLLYTDGFAWQLTEAGRKVLKDGAARGFNTPDPDRTFPTPAITETEIQGLIDTVRANPPVFVDVSTVSPKSAKDSQVGGDHYKKLGEFQPWNVLAHWLTPEELRGYMKGTVIAYLARERDKGGDVDVSKSSHTMQLWEEVRKDK